MPRGQRGKQRKVNLDKEGQREECQAMLWEGMREVLEANNERFTSLWRTM